MGEGGCSILPIYFVGIIAETTGKPFSDYSQGIGTQKEKLGRKIEVCDGTGVGGGVKVCPCC